MNHLENHFFFLIHYRIWTLVHIVARASFIPGPIEPNSSHSTEEHPQEEEMQVQIQPDASNAQEETTEDVGIENPTFQISMSTETSGPILASNSPHLTAKPPGKESKVEVQPTTINLQEEIIGDGDFENPTYEPIVSVSAPGRIESNSPHQTEKAQREELQVEVQPNTSNLQEEIFGDGDFENSAYEHIVSINAPGRIESNTPHPTKEHQQEEELQVQVQPINSNMQEETFAIEGIENPAIKIITSTAV